MATNIELYKLGIDANDVLNEQGKIIDQQAQLRDSMRNTRKETNNLTDATDEQRREYAEQDAQLKKLNTQYNANKKALADHGNETKKSTSFTEKMTASFKGAIVQMAAAYAAIQGLIEVGKSYVKGTFEFLKQQTKVAQQFDISRKEAKSLTTEIRGLAAAYDQDFNEVLKSSNIFAKEFGLSAKESLALVEEGFQRGANVNGEFLEILKEYPAQLRQVGLDARQTIAIITETENQGVFSDKGIDAIKEAGIRLREMTPATRSALNAIGLQGDLIQRSLEDGSTTLFEVIQQVSNQLGTLEEDSPAVGAALADIFGGPGEDAGLRYIKTLGRINTDLDQLESKASDAEKANVRLNKTWVEFQDIVFSGSGGINSSFTTIQNAIIAVLNYIINLRKEGGILMAAFSLIVNTISLNFKTLYTAFEIFLLNPFTSGAKIITAVFKGEFDKVGGLLKEFVENEKKDAIEFGQAWVDAGFDIADAWNGYGEDIAEISEDTGEKIVETAKRVSDAAVDTLKLQLREIESLKGEELKIERDVLDSKQELNDWFYANVKSQRERNAEEEKNFLADQLAVRREFTTRLIDLSGQVLDTVLYNLGVERDNVQNTYDARIAAAEGDAATVKRLEDEKFAKLQEIDRKSDIAQKAAFAREKALKLAAAAIDGAAFILKAGATFGPFGAAAAGIVVAAQLAAIGAQKLPSAGNEGDYSSAAEREQAIIQQLREEAEQNRLDFEERSRRQAEERQRQRAVEERIAEQTQAGQQLQQTQQGIQDVDAFIAELQSQLEAERRSSATGGNSAKIKRLESRIQQQEARRAELVGQADELNQVLSASVSESAIIQDQLNQAVDQWNAVRNTRRRLLDAAQSEDEQQQIINQYQPALDRLSELISRLRESLATAQAEESIQNIIAGARRFAKGGKVTGGIPGKDSVLSLMMPGEEVATVRSANMYPGAVAAMNAGKFDQWIMNYNGNTDNVGITRRLDRLNRTIENKQFGQSSNPDYAYLNAKYGYVR